MNPQGAETQNKNVINLTAMKTLNQTVLCFVAASCLSLGNFFIFRMKTKATVKMYLTIK
jgi:hypothetical protein